MSRWLTVGKMRSQKLGQADEEQLVGSWNPINAWVKVDLKRSLVEFLATMLQHSTVRGCWLATLTGSTPGPPTLGQQCLD